MKLHIPHRIEKEVRNARCILHVMYFTLVSVESGHIYGYVAAMLIILTGCELMEDEHG